MNARTDRKERTRGRIVDTAARLFRTEGYGALGVDRIAAEAGVTSGAFYGHFRSKAAAFQAVVRAGLERLHGAIRRFQDRDAAGWPEALAAWYVGEAHRGNVAGGCLLPSLSPEVVRADEETRAAFGAGLSEAARTLAERPPFDGSDAARERALALLALLAGAAVLGRAVADPAQAERIAAAAREAAALLARGERPGSEDAPAPTPAPGRDGTEPERA